MPIYLYWGEDDFAIQKAVANLRDSAAQPAKRDRVIDPLWTSFNYTLLPSEQPDAVIEGLNQAMTPPFGVGNRLVWLVETNVTQQCSEALLIELKRTLPVIPETTVLLLTCRNKPDGRLKSTQLLQKYAHLREFSLIPPWKTEQLVQQVQQVAQELDLKITLRSAHLIAESVGNDTRQLHSELEKLRLYAGLSNKPLDVDVVTDLVRANTQNSLQLAAAIRDKDVAKSLSLVADLISRNEPALKIVATLTGQFRTWLWVKLMVESGQRDERAIAQAAEIGNPKRVYFLRKEVDPLSLEQLLSTLPLLLELEFTLKQGAEEMSTLQAKVIELCRVF